MNGGHPALQEERRIPLFDDLLDFIGSHPRPEAIAERVRALKVAALREDLSYVGPLAQSVGHRAYDRIVQVVFDSVLRATSREVLLDTFLDEIDALRERSPARCLFVIQTPTRPRDGEPLFLEGFAHRRLQPNRWDNFCTRILPRLGDSPFFDAIFRQQTQVELWNTDYVTQYQGELDSLFFGPIERDKSRRELGYWISAIPLPGASTSHPNRALFVLYPSKGTELERRYPSGATQEWRAMSFLSLAHSVLNHQLASVADMIYARRQELLTSLAPGIIHHEVGMQATNIRALLNDLNIFIRRIYDGCRSADMDRLVNSVAALYPSFERLYGATDAFNNLERRAAYERFVLRKVVNEALAITNYRLGHAGIRVDEGDEHWGIELESDAALLLHLLVNILINATIAFQDGAKGWIPPDHKIISFSPGQISDNREGEWLCLDICNNGPPIPEEHYERIFERGFTTRSGGHGYGLYISRLIAHYLGGELRALVSEELDEYWKAGFRLEIPRVMPRLADMETDRRQDDTRQRR